MHNDGEGRSDECPGALWVLLALLATMAAAGCHRAYYREQADKDAYRLIEEKASHPHWPLPDYAIEVDPRSRMYNPFNPDREPMPPDDPEAHRLMHWVDGKHGYPHWHAHGDTPHVENPDWLAFLPLNEEGVLVLDGASAVQLALLHSRQYQSQLESLYLTALDVSFQRFRFDTQFFGGYLLDYRADGPLRNPAVGSQSVLTAATFPNIEARRLFATGSELVVGFANSLVWQFSGPTGFTSNTVLDFTLIQPLLRGAGRDVVLEGLTQTERALLAEVRQMERFQRAFYVQIMTGRRADPVGFAPGVIPAAGPVTAASATSDSFIGLLQIQQEIRNQQDNLNALRSNYFRLLVSLEELLAMIPEQSEAIVRQRLQVAQARSALLRSESGFLVAQAAFQRSLDAFKTVLGLPPEICVRLEDPMLEQFSLIDPAIRPIQDDVGVLQRRVGDVILELLPQVERPLAWSEQTAARLAELRRLLDGVREIRARLLEGDDAQIWRVQRDGLRLARRLERALELARAEALAAEQAQQAAAWESDLELLQHILRRIDEDPHWFEALSGFNVYREALNGIDRARQQLARGLVDLRWLWTAPNPLLRDLYVEYQQQIEALDQLPADERPAAIAQLDGQLLRHRQEIADWLLAVLDGDPWLGELDRWRISPEEMETFADDPAAVLRRLKRLFAQFVDSMIELPGRFEALSERVRDYQQRIDLLIEDGAVLTPDELVLRFRREISPAIPQELVDLSETVLALSLMQARNRAETVELVEVDVHPAVALEIARQNRRDWMNARTALVDRWRLIELAADALESDLSVVFSGDIRNRDPRNPFSLHSDTGQLRVGLQFDAPLTRLLERNTYREALIRYQQERREYYAFEDAVSRGLRDTLRAMHLNRQNFEIRREAVRAADQQIELNDDIRRIQEAARAVAGPTAARDAVSALADLLSSQNDFLAVWVTYEVLRRTLDLDLGTMQLDYDGLWIDPGPMGPEQGYPGIEYDLLDECWPGPAPLPHAASGATWCPPPSQLGGAAG